MVRVRSSRLWGGVSVFLITCCIAAATQGKYGGGTGEPNAPYQIWDANHMQAIGTDPCDWASHFILMADIDLSAYTADQFNIIGACRWELVGCPWWPCPEEYSWECDPFSGLFDGNGHKISNFTYTGSDDRIGLFREVTGHIKDLGLVGADVTGPNQVGTLVGYLASGSITQCYAEDAVVSGNNSVGGLVGESSGTIADSYALVSVTASDSVGGLVGRNNTEPISRCYAAGEVAGSTNVGGLVGTNGSSTSNSFWDIESSGQPTSAGGRGRTTEQMKDINTFFTWGVCGNEGTWTIDSGTDYPRLAWQNLPGILISIDDHGTIYGGGSGEPNDPYLIYTAEQLNAVDLVPCDWHKHFKLVADIDLEQYDGKDGREEFNMIGKYVDFEDPRNRPFVGVFDGDGHVIRNFSYAAAEGEKYLGVFRSVSGPDAEVKNVGMVDASIWSTGPYTSDIGSLIGRLEYGTVSNCFATDCNLSGDGYTGGLVGRNIYGTVQHCYSTGIVSGGGGGGLIGRNYGGPVRGCYSTASVLGVRVGGLLGENWFAMVSGCYATGDVQGTWSAGGLVGDNSGDIHNCYSTGSVDANTRSGGLVAKNGSLWGAGLIINSYWDVETSGEPNMCGFQTDDSSGCDNSYGKTTGQMKQQATFVDWDFIDVWAIGEGQTYPYLRTFPASDLNEDGITNFLDFCIIAEEWSQEQ
jgi:hypothetical protein